MRNVCRVVAIVVAVAGVAGCTLEQLAKLPSGTARFQILSAGHTGCMPQDNQVSLLAITGDVALWTATCKEKTYLCSGAAVVGSSEASSCAPEVK